MKKKLEQEIEMVVKSDENGEATNVYGSKLKDVWKIKELQDTIETLYKVIGKLYIENERLKAMQKLKGE